MVSTRFRIKAHLANAEDMLPVISASTIGSVIQWFDFYLYSVLSVAVFPVVFFPRLDAATAIIASFGTSSVGFIARPLGGAFFGWFGDRIGRRSTLVATLLTIGITTMLMGILPGYATWGIAAPVLLTILRFLQGIGVGGEWGGSTLLIMENSDNRHRGFWTSWSQAGVPIGLALAMMSMLLFRNLYPSDAYQNIGWRIPFLLSPIILVAGFYIRLRIPETPHFASIQAAKQESKAPLRDVFRYQWREVVLCTLLRSGDQAPFYIFTLFILSYFQYPQAGSQAGLHYSIGTLQLQPDLLYIGLIIAALLEVFIIPVLGRFSDRIGHKRCFLIGCITTATLALPYFWLLNTRNIGLVWLAILLSLDVCHALVYAPQAALIAERFGTKVRYTGASLGFQLSSITAGGPAPLIATYLLADQITIGRPIAPYILIAIFIMFMSAISFLAALPLKDYTGQAPAGDRA